MAAFTRCPFDGSRRCSRNRVALTSRNSRPSPPKGTNTTMCGITHRARTCDWPAQVRDGARSVTVTALRAVSLVYDRLRARTRSDKGSNVVHRCNAFCDRVG